MLVAIGMRCVVELIFKSNFFFRIGIRVEAKSIEPSSPRAPVEIQACSRPAGLHDPPSGDRARLPMCLRYAQRSCMGIEMASR